MTIKKVLFRSVLTLGSACCLTAATVSAQEVYSSIIGAVSMTVPASSDLYVTPSFNNSAVFRGEATSAGAGSVGFTGTSFEVDGFASGFRLLVEEGSLEGRVFEITANTATGLTVSDPDSELAAAQNVVVSIIPALTLGEMFPNGIGGQVEVNPGDPDVVLFSNDNSAGVEGLAPESIYYYGDIGGTPGWRKVGAPLTEVRDSDTLPIGEGFVVRNNTTADVSFFLFGEVMLSKLQIPIASSDSGATDNLVGAPRPLDIPLGELGLESVVGLTTAADDVKDTVRVFTSQSMAKNPSPSAIYCRWSDGWRAVVDGTVDTSGDPLDSVTISAASALVVRKVATVESQVVYWSNTWDLPTQS